MKRLTYLTFVVLGLIVVMLAPARADAELGSVTGAGQGLFEDGATLGAVNLEGVELGIGVFVDPDGSATGVFHAVLVGHSLLGESEITVEGEVSAGGLGASGDVILSGVAIVDLGDGTPALPAVPFSMTFTNGTVVLAFESTTLAAAGMAADSITIE